MEWRKAIIILIISFVLLNLFLVSNIWNKTKPVNDFNLTQTQQEQIETLLKQKNVSLDVDIPHEGKPQSFLEISLRPIDEEKTLERFFGENSQPILEYKNDSKNYILDEKQLIITQNGEITYFDNREGKEATSLTKEKAKKMAEEFLESHGEVLEQAVLSNMTYDARSKGYLLEYTRYHEGFFIANSYAAILVTPSGVKMYHQCWMYPVSYIGRKRSVISPLTAVMRVATEIETQEPFVISDVEQGFYSKSYNADRIQAAPVWKIGLDNGNIYYINAYTGEIEQ